MLLPRPLWRSGRRACVANGSKPGATRQSGNQTEEAKDGSAWAPSKIGQRPRASFRKTCDWTTGVPAGIPRPSSAAMLSAPVVLLRNRPSSARSSRTVHPQSQSGPWQNGPTRSGQRPLKKMPSTAFFAAGIRGRPIGKSARRPIGLQQMKYPRQLSPLDRSRSGRGGRRTRS